MTIDEAAPFFAWDVSAWLLAALFVAFVIVFVDKFFVAPSDDENEENGENGEAVAVEQKSPWRKIGYFLFFLKFSKSENYAHRPKIVRYAAEFFPVLLLVFVLRSFALEPFRIPSNSMMPTLLTGDFIVVNKFIYGVRLPLTNTKLLPVKNPERGDVVVFRYPNYERNPSYQGADFIKRIIGVPGDKIIYSQDHLRVNGEKIRYRDLGVYTGVESGRGMTGFHLKKELLDGADYQILLAPDRYAKGVRATVPAGHYFVMGDNRTRSHDSRFWGFVPAEYIIGKAFGVWMHFDESFKFDRLGGID